MLRINLLIRLINSELYMYYICACINYRSYCLRCISTEDDINQDCIDG